MHKERTELFHSPSQRPCCRSRGSQSFFTCMQATEDNATQHQGNTMQPRCNEKDTAKQQKDTAKQRKETAKQDRVEEMAAKLKVWAHPSRSRGIVVVSLPGQVLTLAQQAEWGREHTVCIVHKQPLARVGETRSL